MRKTIKLILIFVVLLPIVLLGVGVATFYGLFYDATPSPVLKDETFTSEKMIKNIIGDSFENAEKNKAIRVGLKEDDINQLLLMAADSMNETAKQFVGAPYVDITKDNHFDIYLNAGVPIFKTRAKLSTSIDFARLGDENHHEGILFTINDIKIGRTSVGDFAINVAKKFINNETIESAFKNAGFNIKCNLEKKALFYNAYDLLNDVMKDKGIDPFYLSMIDMVVEKDFLGISYTDNSFGLDLKLEKLLSNALADDTRNLGYGDKIETYLTYTEDLLNANVIDESKVNIVLDYFCDGYENTSIDNKAFIDELTFPSSINIDKKNHKGLQNAKTEDIDDVFVSKLPKKEEILATLKSQQFDISFKESDINKTLVCSKIIGQMMPFVYHVGHEMRVNAIYIDDFYVNILDNQLNFVISVSINGLSTKLIVPCIIKGQEGMSLKLSIKDIYYGQVKANQKMSDSCIQYITDALSNLNTWFKKGEGNDIVFDLSSCLNRIDSKDELYTELKEKLSSATINSSLDGIKSSDDGKLKLTFKFAYGM